MRKSDRDKAIDVLERVTSAVELLCVGEGHVNQRLVPALGQLVPLLPTDFPDDLQEHFEEIMALSTRYDASDLDRMFPLPGGRSHNESEGLIKSTMRRIRRKTGAKIARKIWALQYDLCKIAE